MKVFIVLQCLISTAISYKIIVDSSSPRSVNNTQCWPQPTTTSGNVNTLPSEALSSSHNSCATLDLGIQGLSDYVQHFGQFDNAEKVLLISHGEYRLTVNDLEFINVNGVTIKSFTPAEASYPNSFNSSTSKSYDFRDGATVIICAPGIGFSFIKSTGITIIGITFINCGQLQTSTSVNQTTLEFIETVVAFYFLYCSDVFFQNVTVTKTEGTAVYLYNVVGSNIFDECNFESNKFTNIAGGGGVYIEYSYCEPMKGHSNGCINETKSESNVIDSYTKDGSFVMKRCKFHDNKAFFPLNSSNDSNEPYVFMLPGGYNHSAFGTGGGLSVYFKGNATNNQISIHNCTFVNNVALWGGGLFIQFEDYANNNMLTVTNSFFRFNNASYKATTNDGTAGGGVRLAFFQQGGHRNIVTYRNCSFSNNIGYYGGGLSFYSSLWNGHNNVSFEKCYFRNNYGRIGSAIDLSTTQWISEAHDGPGDKTIISIPYVYMRECEYTRNKDFSDGLIGIGAVNQNGVLTIVERSAIFKGNSRSALSLNNAAMNITSHTNITFYKNTGRYGGAVALFGTAHIIVADESVVYFKMNKAQYLGGAIYHTSLGVYDFIYSRDCFIQYHDFTTPPKNWTARFIFKENHANGKLNAIYASTLLPCKRDVHFGSLDRALFCIESIWDYDDTCDQVIATAPSEIDISSHTMIDKPQIIPGNLPIKLDYKLYENTTYFQVASETSLVASIVKRDSQSASFTNGSQFDYVSHENLFMHGTENTTIFVSLETMDPIVVESCIAIEFQKCPPAFEFDAKSMKCKCTKNYKEQVKCDQITFTAKIARTSWMGPLNEHTANSSRDLYVGFSPFVMKESLSEFIVLPSSISELNDVLCNKTNRKGTLCGECKPGYGVSVNTKDYDCVPCNNNHVHVNFLYYILSEFIPVTFFFISVFLFSMRITHGPLNSFVFFSQTITTVIQLDAHGLTPIQRTVKLYDFYNKTYMTIYDFWNLNFFRSILPGFCLSHRLGTLDVLMLGYITALYPLLLILVLMVIIRLYNQSLKPVVVIVRPFHYLLARFRQITNLRQSITSGIAVFILMSYTKLVSVSFNLIPFYHLYSSDGTAKSAVFYHQGSIKYPEEGRVYIAAASFVLFFCILLPVILAYPLLLRLLEKCKIIRKRVRFERLHPGHKVQTFLDEFYGCYKNGSCEGQRDCRWFSSFYFILRIALFLAFSQVETWQQLYILQSIVFLICTVMFATIRPYREDWINNLDITVFAILTAVSSFSLYNLQLATMQKKISVFAFYVQFSLTMLPCIVCLVYYSFLLIRWYKEKYSTCFRRKTNINVTSYCTDDHEADSHHSFNESTYITRFFNFVGMSGRHIPKLPKSTGFTTSVVSLASSSSDSPASIDRPQNYGAIIS